MNMWRDFLQLFKSDNLQVQALDECYAMLDLSHKMVLASVESLRRRDDSTVDFDIYEMDKKLNSFERDVRRKVMTHLCLGHKPDIAAGLALVSVVIDIERIGDYAKNIYDLARLHPKRVEGGQFEERIAEVEKNALELFERTAQTFRSGDVDEARRLMVTYKEEISRQSDLVADELVAGSADMAASQAVTIALYVRYLKRIAAHSRNLISSIVNPVDRIGYPE